MTGEPVLLNPDGKLAKEIAKRLCLARKTKSLWGKRLDRPESIKTLEGIVNAAPGDYLCRGIKGETWPQKPERLSEKYISSGALDEQGWERFDPKPDAAPVEAAQIETAFRVTAHWGALTGKAGDYLVRSTSDPTDIWIVDRAIFEASYEQLTPSSKPPNSKFSRKVIGEEGDKE